MKLPLLGIITIVALQLGFTAYNAMDRPLSSLYAVKVIANSVEPLAVLPSESDSDTYAVASADVRNLRVRDVNFAFAGLHRRPRFVEQKVIFRNIVIKIPPAKSLMPQLVAMQRPWDSAMPKQPQPTRSGGESENFPVSSVRSSEKRSFVSRSVSVLKKPYDWVKALGSKFN